ncbi:MAG TPA: glycosyltransferase family 1 protein [Jatrophihabitans sp.]|nr:glycosyltransferase family 1 protein [Jatrophihabitans sp.]
MLFDATAVPADRRGVGRYVDSVIPAFAGTEASIRVLCRPEDVEHYRQLSGQPAVAAPRLTGRRPTRLVWEQLGLPGLARAHRPDVLHSPHYTHPMLLSLTRRLPLAVTLHDATFFTDPGLHTRAKGPFFRTAARLALRGADACLVPSQATADELVAHAGARPEQLQVAHLGVDTSVFRPPTEQAKAAVRASLGLESDLPYFAFLGTIEPRKNVPALIRGWAAAFAHRADPPALVLAGGAGWDTEVDAAIAELPATLRLIRPGYLPLDQLAGLLGGAEVVVYPSLGEGFGLPVLEGMACGAAVLTTRNLALAEVGGDAVAYTGTEPAAIGRALVELIDDPERRERLGKLGLARAELFSWQSCAQAHVKAYHSAIERHGARR